MRQPPPVERLRQKLLSRHRLPPPWVLLLSLALTPLPGQAQGPAYPFPHHTRYAAGILPDTARAEQMDSAVQCFFQAWRAQYLRRSLQGDGYYVDTKGRYKSEDCVSEAMGYGMMILALMADSANSEQNRSLFDSLFYFVRAHPSYRDRPGTYHTVSSILMASAQKIHKNRVIDIDNTSASDGDIDIAFSLLLAAQQWPNATNVRYAHEARRIIDSIFAQEINPAQYTIIQSNASESDGSPDYNDFRTSDFIPSELKGFGRFRQDARWDRVVDSNYTLLGRLRDRFSPVRHLFADFYERIGNGFEPGRRKQDEKFANAYSFNACRVPWRIGTDYLITRDERSKDLLRPLNNWFIETTRGEPARINAGYLLTSVAKGNHPEKDSFMLSFIAPLGVSAMADSSYKPWLNKIWALTVRMPLHPSGDLATEEYGYFENTIKLLCMIIMSGNYWEPGR
ncbi:MAG TPA: glycosyl hydrolase family 8 [Puia sp.]|nr:glycosyl hydrolase family 8 [Puia sp.]